jgi:hypothetical protein
MSVSARALFAFVLFVHVAHGWRPGFTMIVRIGRVTVMASHASK